MLFGDLLAVASSASDNVSTVSWKTVTVASAYSIVTTTILHCVTSETVAHALKPFQRAPSGV